jgi:hypothetical protein
VDIQDILLRAVHILDILLPAPAFLLEDLVVTHRLVLVSIHSSQEVTLSKVSDAITSSRVI